MRIITIEETGEDLVLDDDYTISDHNGTLWSENGYITITGAGDSFGPGNKHVPSIVKAIRKEKNKDKPPKDDR